MADKSSKGSGDERTRLETEVRELQAKADGPDATEEDTRKLAEARGRVAALPPVPSTIAAQQYAPAEGWDVGNRAPATKYGKIDPQGNVTVGDPADGEAGTIIVVRGDTINAEQARLLSSGKS